MFRFTKWIAAPVVAIGMFFAADAPNADAQGFSLSINNGYRGYGYSVYRPPFGYGYGSGYGHGHVHSHRPIVVPVPVDPYCPSRSSFYGGYGNFTPSYPGYYDR